MSVEATVIGPVNILQFLKQPFSKVLISEVRFLFVSFEHPQKHLSSREVTLLGNVIDSNELQFMKHMVLRHVKFSESVMFVNVEQPEKTCSPIQVTESGITILVKGLRLQNFVNNKFY